MATRAQDEDGDDDGWEMTSGIGTVSITRSTKPISRSLPSIITVDCHRLPPPTWKLSRPA